MLTHPVSTVKIVPFLFINDISASTRGLLSLCDDSRCTKSANTLINEENNKVVSSLCENTQLRVRARISVINYSNYLEVMVPDPDKPGEYKFEYYPGCGEDNPDIDPYFNPISEVKGHLPEIKPTGGCTYTARAIDAACDLRCEYSKQILSYSVCDVSPSVIVLFTDGDECWQESDEYIDQVARRVNELSYAQETDKKTIFIVVGLGDNLSEKTKKNLARFGEPLLGKGGFFWIKGETDDKIQKGIEALYALIGQSIVASGSYVENSVNDTVDGSIDSLLANLRQQVQEICPDLVCTIE